MIETSHKPYRFVNGEYSAEIDIKRSKFIATIKGEVDADGAEAFVKEIRKKYPDARHNCYAYISDESGNAARFSDDGEPSGTAGQPMLEVLKKKGLVKTAVVVTRYFGGILLGAGGLLGAYTQAVAEAINKATISEKLYAYTFEIVCGYPAYSALEKTLRKGRYDICSVEYGDSVKADVRAAEAEKDSFPALVAEATGGNAKINIIDEGYAALAAARKE